MYVRQRIPVRPSIRVDREFGLQCGGVVVAGVDEAGRGPLAGPVVAAAVVLSLDGRRPLGLRDSKQLNAKERERAFRQIVRLAVGYGIGVSTAQEIDLVNILEATRLAASRALAQISPPPGALVTDALDLPREAVPQLPLVKGDQISASIAAASILAKVTRDRMMQAYAEEFPEYNWASNKGYPTEDHYAAIGEHGPCTLHRLSFRGVDFFHAEPRRSPSFHRLCARIESGCPREEARLEVEPFAARLPPPDYEELMRLLSLSQPRGQDTP